MSPKLNFFTIILLFLVLAVNIVLLDLMVFSSSAPTEPLSIIAAPTPTPIVEVTSGCSPACTSLIAQEVSKITSLPASYSPTSTPVTAITPPVKELYVPLGTGTTKSSNWDDLPGAEVLLNRDNYSEIKQVTLEVFMHIPTGNGRIYVKLFNVTDGHDVWFSEVWSEGDKIAKKTANINLDPGQKLYRLMAKSSMSYEAVVDSARIKIVTK